MKRCLLFLCVVFASIGGCYAQNQPQTPIRATATASDEEHALVATWRVVEWPISTKTESGCTCLGSIRRATSFTTQPGTYDV